MPTTTGLTAQQLQAKIDELKATGATESTSKSLGKYVNALKVLQPTKFGTEDVASAQAKLASSTQQPQVTGAGSAVAGSTGLGFSGAGTTGAGTSGGIDLNAIYNNALASPELTGLQKELDTKKAALNTALSNINDNPLYSEATRVGKIAKLNEQANREISTLSDQVTQKRADAQIKVNIATQQYNIQNQEYQNNVSRLNMLISSGALLNASGSDIANIALATGMSTSMVNGIVSKMKSDQIKPTIINKTDDSGNVTVVAIDEKTGKVLYKTSVGKIDQSKKAGGTEKLTQQEASQLATQAFSLVSGKDGYVSEGEYTAKRNVWASYGFKPEDFDSLFYTYINPKYYASYGITNKAVEDRFVAPEE